MPRDIVQLYYLLPDRNPLKKLRPRLIVQSRAKNKSELSAQCCREQDSILGETRIPYHLAKVSFAIERMRKIVAGFANLY